MQPCIVFLCSREYLQEQFVFNACCICALFFSALFFSERFFSRWTHYDYICSQLALKAVC